MNSIHELNKKYSYSSLQVDLPSEQRTRLIDWGSSKVSDSEVYWKDESFGRELDSHVTILYGINDSSEEGTRKLLRELGKNQVHVEFGKTEIFEQDEYDVLVVKVISDDLKEIHEHLRENIKCDGWALPEYKSHATIAYLVKGDWDHLKNLSINGLHGFNSRNLAFSASDAEVGKVNIQLSNTKSIKEIVSSLDEVGRAERKKKSRLAVEKMAQNIANALKKVKDPLTSSGDQEDSDRYNTLAQIYNQIKDSGSEREALEYEAKFKKLWQSWNLDEISVHYEGDKEQQQKQEKEQIDTEEKQAAGEQIGKLLDRIAGHIALSDSSKSKEIISNQLKTFFKQHGVLESKNAVSESIIDGLTNNTIGNMVSGVARVFSPGAIVKNFFSLGSKVVQMAQQNKEDKKKAIYNELDGNLKALKERRIALKRDLAALKRLFYRVYGKNTETRWAEFYGDNLVKVEENMDNAIELAEEIVSMIKSGKHEEAEQKIKQLESAETQ